MVKRIKTRMSLDKFKAWKGQLPQGVTVKARDTLWITFKLLMALALLVFCAIYTVMFLLGFFFIGYMLYEGRYEMYGISHMDMMKVGIPMLIGTIVSNCFWIDFFADIRVIESQK